MKIHLGIGISFLLVLVLLSSCSSSHPGIIIFCAGDSITETGYLHFLKMILNKDGIRGRILNYGRSGYTSGEYLNFLKKNKETLKTERPDFVLLQLGTNDVRLDADSTPSATFKTNMKKIVEIFRRFKNRRGKETVILLATIPPIPEGSPFPFSSDSAKRVRDEINPVIRNMCEEEQILMVDNYSLFINSPFLLPEVHPNQEGYRALAKNWYRFLEPLLKRK
jgi:lysophospholipase L1-like esterase